MRFQTLSHPSKVVWFDPALVNSVNSTSGENRVEYATALAVKQEKSNLPAFPSPDPFYIKGLYLPFLRRNVVLQKSPCAKTRLVNGATEFLCRDASVGFS